MTEGDAQRRQGHWRFSPAVKDQVTGFLQSILLPRSWGVEHRRAFRSSDSNELCIPALKAHTNHVFVGSGLLAVCAAWPRAADEMNNTRIRDFAVALQQFHRTATRYPMTPEVGDPKKPI